MGIDLDLRNKKLKSNHTTKRLVDKPIKFVDNTFNLNPPPSYR
jgi:hypothetical protein